MIAALKDLHVERDALGIIQRFDNLAKKKGLSVGIAKSTANGQHLLISSFDKLQGLVVGNFVAHGKQGPQTTVPIDSF